MDRWEVAIVHAFQGDRFEAGHLDVEVAPELSAYRELVIDVAKSLWLREHEGRQRLPRNFEGQFQLRISGLGRGSAITTLSRNVATGQQLNLAGEPDVFTRAMRLVEDSVNAVVREDVLPSEFPRSALTKFRRWGASLGEDECVELRTSQGQALARYGAAARASLLDRIDTSYENLADETGYVLATSIRAGRFELYRRLHSGEGVDVPLLAEHKEKVLQALARHDEVRIRVVGIGAFAADGCLVKFTSVERVEEVDREVNNAGLWERIDALSQSVSDEGWGALSADAAENHDVYL